MSRASATVRHPEYPITLELVPESPQAGVTPIWSAVVPSPGGVIVPALDVPCRVRITDARGEVYE